MELLEFLKKWGIHQDVIAKAIGVSRGTFGSKVRRHFRHRLSANDKAKIVAFINSIPRVTEADLFPEHEQPAPYMKPKGRSAQRGDSAPASR